MHIRYDGAASALRIQFHEVPVTTRLLSEGIVGQFDAQGRLAGIEILDAAQHLSDVSTFQQVVRAGLGPPIADGAPPSTIVAEHIVLDERGVAWVDDTNVKVIEIVLDKIGQGLSPEAIQAAHPGMFSLAQIHAALTYYYDHQGAFDVEIDRQHREYLAAREAQKNSPLLQKLRAGGKSA